LNLYLEVVVLSSKLVPLLLDVALLLRLANQQGVEVI
jgi:hypothetical protein